MVAVRFITTYCRKNGEIPINVQRVEQDQFEDNNENQVIEMWLQGYLASKEESKSIHN